MGRDGILKNSKIMSNTSKGKATKGSKLMMQMATSPLQKVILDNYFNEELVWFSPVENDDFEEFQMSEDKVCVFLGIKKDEKTFAFWPRRQPQWDGIAIGKTTGNLYLFEAKSHLNETQTDCKATSEHSKKQIKNTFFEIAKQVYNIDDNYIIENYWMNNNYQLANRLVFLQKMKEISEKAQFYNGVKLVLLNFVNDPTWGDKERVQDNHTWIKSYDEKFKNMGISRNQLINEGVIEIEYSAPFIC